MSSSGSRTEDLLRAEVQELRQSHRVLSEKVGRLEDRISELSFRLEASTAGHREVEENKSVHEEVPCSASTVFSYSEVEEASVPPPYFARGGDKLPVEEQGYTRAFRQQIAKQIGEFLRRSVGGQHRGSSGRDQLRGLQSRYYIVIRDFSGYTTTRPVRVFTNYSKVRDLCYRGGSWGDSIFVGVPTAEEGELAVSIAGCSWPAADN